MLFYKCFMFFIGMTAIFLMNKCIMLTRLLDMTLARIFTFFDFYILWLFKVNLVYCAYFATVTWPTIVRSWVVSRHHSWCYYSRRHHSWRHHSWRHHSWRHHWCLVPTTVTTVIVGINVIISVVGGIPTTLCIVPAIMWLFVLWISTWFVVNCLWAMWTM